MPAVMPSAMPAPLDRLDAGSNERLRERGRGKGESRRRRIRKDEHRGTCDGGNHAAGKKAHFHGLLLV
jgi:hypothetical protein